ncbi:MAG: alpha-L-fucosidase [Candidatus Hydrogenedentes bacterium]|nr:alpha-L-fucosidase [Candidatus Hydrogenedentota bacterium]
MRAVICILICASAAAGPQSPADNDTRARDLANLRCGMFVCWSLSTFSGHEWTRGIASADFFKATGCDTDQWCQTAKDAGMGYILFLTKHHDGFCLWDTKTTDFKVTKSPLHTDVLAALRKSCDKFGLKLALYFSEGDWTWLKEPLPQDGLLPGSPNWGNPVWASSKNPDAKKAQLEELVTQYGPIAFFWMDYAQGDGGLSHQDTADWVHRFQPNCFVGFNSGEPAGDLCLREMGKPGPLGDAAASAYNKKGEETYKGYLVAEFTYPILPSHEGGADWFYSLPKHDPLCRPAEQLFEDYLGAVKYGNIFSIDAGPDYQGRLRDIDAATLRKLGEMIRSSQK